MRKLPVFFLIDVSESMAGPRLDAVTSGLADVLASLRKDPYALETVHLSVIAFAGKAKVLTPMIELIRFYTPELPIGGGTGLATGLDTLMAEIDTHVVKGSAGRKGDWQPLVFLMTDGRPTDAPDAAIARWRRDYAGRARLVAVSVGAAADHALLRRLTEEIVVLNDASPDSFRRFLRWVSDSISTQSRLVEEPARAGISLIKDLPAGASALGSGATPEHGCDDRVAVFVARCQQTEAPWLARYEALGTQEDGTLRYDLRGTVPLKESYFDLCAQDAAAGEVSFDALSGIPGCPHCGTRIGLVACGCGRLHCIPGPGPAICPWCHAEANYQPAAAGTRIDFGRSAG